MPLNSLWPGSWPQWNYADLGTPSMQQTFMNQYPGASWAAAIEPARLYGSRGFYNYLRQSMPEYQNRYMGQLGTGQIAPTMDFYSWLTGSDNLGGVNGYTPNGFNPMADYQRLSPIERGERPAAFSSRGRWIG